MKKVIVTTILLIIIGAIIFLYATRAPSAPSENAGTAAGQMNDSTLTASTTYRISSADSSVVFRINEILNDKPFTAIGTTSEIGGDLSITKDGLVIGTVAVNARTFKTDSEKRDGAIARFILKSEDAANEFIYFKPTSVQTQASTTTSGQTSAIVSGQLTLSGVTKTVSFPITYSIVADTISGTGTMTLKRSDYNLVIPNVPFVASVEDQFTVTARVVAKKVQ